MTPNKQTKGNTLNKQNQRFCRNISLDANIAILQRFKSGNSLSDVSKGRNMPKSTLKYIGSNYNKITKCAEHAFAEVAERNSTAQYFKQVVRTYNNSAGLMQKYKNEY